MSTPTEMMNTGDLNIARQPWRICAVCRDTVQQAKVTYNPETGNRDIVVSCHGRTDHLTMNGTTGLVSHVC